jgi:cytochrome P450
VDEVSLEGFNPFDFQVQQSPHPYYAAMRAQTPVFHVPGTDIYLVTRHDLIVPILRDTATFSNKFLTGEMAQGPVVEKLKEIMSEGWPQVPTMLTIDPPWHTRYRGTVAPFFTPRRIAELRPAVLEIVDRLIDGWIDEGRIEFVQRFGVPLPIEAIAVVLNVPKERMDDFKRWSDDSIAAIGAVISDARRIEAQFGILELQQYLAAQLEQRRAEPRDDLMTQLVQAEIDTDEGTKRPLEMAEMLSILQQLLVAGNETTTKALTEGMMLLASAPDEWRALQDDPAGRAALVTEEVLRLATPTQGMFRIVTKDTEIDGVPVPAGARLVVMYSAANRDPEVFDEPDGFCPARANLKEHLAFGKGIHFCIGAPLSRLEMQVAFERLGARLGDLRLAEGNDFEYHPSFVLRGLKRLDVEFTRAKVSA